MPAIPSPARMVLHAGQQPTETMNAFALLVTMENFANLPSMLVMATRAVMEPLVKCWKKDVSGKYLLKCGTIYPWRKDVIEFVRHILVAIALLAMKEIVARRTSMTV